MLDRRRFLTSVALITAVPACLVANRARALRLEEAAIDVAEHYRAARPACAGKDVGHQQILAEFEASLAGRPLSDAEKAALRAALNCPLCGCSLGGS